MIKTIKILYAVLLVVSICVVFTNADGNLELSFEFFPNEEDYSDLYGYLFTARIIATKKDSQNRDAIVGSALCSYMTWEDSGIDDVAKMYSTRKCSFDGEMTDDVHVLLIFSKNHEMKNSWAESHPIYYGFNPAVHVKYMTEKYGLRDGKPLYSPVKIRVEGMGKIFTWDQNTRDLEALMADPSKSIYDHGLYLVKRQKSGFSFVNMYYDPYEVTGYLT
ncbi:unnamed protein product [Caenorhabditis auriculariae]|uniref:Uncharacterized protein n=1 Tax=Caenorhabditis auriculariae TaxID=2777116 RepID=A0A8S1H3T4_9PELO|nr:unnamed protein product [Caenorhabditis auriculariae]